MNTVDKKYTKYGLCSDMSGTASVINQFNTDSIDAIIAKISNHAKLFITGEGSSRIFPAKNVIYKAMQHCPHIDIKTEGACQAQEYNLFDYAVFGVSNSGKTSEVIELFNRLKKIEHQRVFGITAHKNTPLEQLSKQTHVLSCGSENAVAATKSVVEQALFFDLLLSRWQQIKTPPLSELAAKFTRSLTSKIPAELIDKTASAEVIYFAGRNNGVAEELTLKTNEILRKKSDFLEGTYAIHGIEEVMTERDVLILIDPVESEELKFKKFIADGAGVNIIAIADRPTLFPTLLIPQILNYNSYLQLAMGWNLLAECGIKLGINIDKPERARKIGNEFILKDI